MQSRQIESRTTKQLVKGVFRGNPLYDKNKNTNVANSFMNRVKLAFQYARINRQELKRSNSIYSKADETQTESENLKDVFNDLLDLVGR
jgi:hypothetical protein